MITFPEKTQIQDRWVCMLVHGAHTMFYLPIHSKVCESHFIVLTDFMGKECRDYIRNGLFLFLNVWEESKVGVTC
jgi:hypothetical protein